MKAFTADDVQAAHDQLRPHIQKLVDRFGQAQAFEIATSVAWQVCPDGASQMPEFIRPGKSDEKPVN